MGYLNNINFNPINVQDDKYATDLDVDFFYTKYRNLSIPSSEYVLLDPLPLQNNINRLTIFFMNIRSIPTNFQTFVDHILGSTSLKLNVIGFTETRLDSDLAAVYQLPGYNLYTKCRNRNGGGVAMYISSDYYCTELTDASISEPFIEAIFVETTIMNKPYLFGCIYRPPSGNLDAFFASLLAIFRIINAKKYHSVNLIGDWNLDLLKHNENSSVHEFINIMYSNSLFPLTTKPTRVTDTTATIIDHIWTSLAEINTGNYIIQTDITDHFPILSQFELININANIPVYIQKRIMSTIALNLFNSEVEGFRWDRVFVSQCPLEAYNLFYEGFNILFQKHFPLKSVCINNKHEHRPYITLALKNSIKEKHRLERLANKWPLTYGNTYKTYRNKLTSILRAAKNKYYKDQLKDNQGDPKSHWNSINSLLGRSNAAEEKSIHLKPHSNDVANDFNEHFLKAGQTLSTSNVDNNEYLQYLCNPPNFSLYLTPVSNSEIEHYIKNLKLSAPGYDDFSAKLLKCSSGTIAIIFKHIINLSFRKGVFPDKLKLAKVIPVHKSGSKEDINNYRPISILPVFSKIMEKAISTRLVNFLENNNLLSNSQFGFRQNRSTESALIQFVNNVYNCLEEKLFVAGVFIDLSKAFDSLDHNILIEKLKHVGIRGTPLQLFKSYLDSRSQAVYCNSSKSEFKLISKGVPQGSILGPILFLIYINDITRASSKFQFVIYADDTNLLLADKNINSLYTNLNNELKCIARWVKCNKLKLNVSKTNYMLFQNRSIKNDMPPLSLENEIIKRVQYTKFLGVYIDENLNWSHHINSVCLKLSKMCGVLYRVRHQLTLEAMISIYYTLCYPHLTYCVSIWGCTWPSFLNRIRVAQSKVIRCILFLGKFDSTENSFITHNLLKFNYVHKYFTLLFIYNNITGCQTNSLFKFVNIGYRTRGNNINLKCPQFRTVLFKNSIFCAGPQLWNSLPIHFKNLINYDNNKSAFKMGLKKHLFAEQGAG